MAVVTSAVIGAVGTAYSIASAEEQKNKARKAGQKADAQKYKMEVEQKNEKEKQKAEAARDAAIMQQRSGQLDSADNKSLLGGGASANAGGANKPVTQLGQTQSGKTLLGV